MFKNIKWDLVAKFSAIILFSLTTITGAIAWVVNMEKEKAEAEANLRYQIKLNDDQKKFNEKYEEIITDNIELRINCDANSK